MTQVNAIRDGNNVPVALGVSTTASNETLPFKIDEATGKLQVSAITSLTEGSIPFIGASGELAQDNADLFWLAASDALQLGSGSSLELYNTADKTTNYERLRADWSGNIARLYVQSAGTGIDRDFRVGTSTLYHVYQQRTNASPVVAFTLSSATSSTVATGLNQLLSGTLNASSGAQTPVSIAPTINQSGTAGYTALDINPTESATGSGTKLLQRWAVGGSAKAQLSTTGVFGTSGLLAGSSSTIGFSSDFTLVGQDVSVARDAADTLALRRSANAQTFRVYNTYTDASNGEWGFVRWAANEFLVGNSFNGTGVVRPMSFQIANVTRWTINTSGNFVASLDNTYDIGASGANRPRAVHAALAFYAPEWRLSLVTVAGLSATNNSRMMVSDSTLPFAAANIGTAVTGGGANTVPVIRIAGTWYIG